MPKVLYFVLPVLHFDENTIKSLNSISRQNSKNLEVKVVLVTNSIVPNSYSQKEHIKVIQDSNRGVYSALNLGLKDLLANNASSQEDSYVTFVSNGAVQPNENVFDQAIESISTSRGTVIAGYWLQNNTNGKARQYRIGFFPRIRQALALQPINIEALILPISVIQQVHFDEDLIIASDIDFVSRVLRSYKLSVYRKIMVVLPPPGLSGEFELLGSKEVDLILNSHKKIYRHSVLFQIFTFERLGSDFVKSLRNKLKIVRNRLRAKF